MRECNGRKRPGWYDSTDDESNGGQQWSDSDRGRVYDRGCRGQRVRARRADGDFAVPLRVFREQAFLRRPPRRQRVRIVVPGARAAATKPKVVLPVTPAS